MSVIGIVCEYNPFHNGHKYLIGAVKGENDVVVAVMSGNFVQRAEPALFPKEVRVEAALKNGIDIVIELPFLYAAASAEIFAEAAVTLLDSMGCEKIAFGSENGDISLLSRASSLLSSDSFDAKVKKYLEHGMSYPSARQAAFDEFNCPCDISSPNNILALEYLKAIAKRGSDMIPVAVKRLGAGYNERGGFDGFASATYIRELILADEPYEKYVPSNCVDIYTRAVRSGNCLSAEKYNTAALALLRSRLREDWSETANTAEGLHNRLISAVNESVTLSEVYDKAKTKRFTHSRIRRTVLSACFGITKDDLKIPVPYCRVLGFKTELSKRLGQLASSSDLPFAAGYKDIKNINSQDAGRVFAIQDKSANFYNLILQKPRACSSEMTFAPIKMK